MKRRKTLLIGGLVLILLGACIAGGYFWRGKTVNNMISDAIAVPENPVSPGPTGQKTVNVLLLGSDSRGGEVGRTDSIIFVSVNLETQKVSMLSIPRDTRVEIPGVGLTKITHANVVGGKEQGIEKVIQSVSNLLGVPINNYALIDFQGFKKLVDAVGGIDIELANGINDYMQKLYLPAGLNHLDGEQALRLARVRYSLSNGDFGRQWYQYKILAAIADKALSSEGITKLPQLLKIAGRDLVQTDMTQAEILALATKFVGFKGSEINYYQIPGGSLTAQDPLVGANVYYFEADKTELKEIMQKIYGPKA